LLLDVGRVSAASPWEGPGRRPAVAGELGTTTVFHYLINCLQFQSINLCFRQWAHRRNSKKHKKHKIIHIRCQYTQSH